MMAIVIISRAQFLRGRHPNRCPDEKRVTVDHRSQLQGVNHGTPGNMGCWRGWERSDAKVSKSAVGGREQIGSAGRLANFGEPSCGCTHSFTQGRWTNVWLQVQTSSSTQDPVRKTPNGYRIAAAH